MSKKFANRLNWFIVVSLFVHMATYLSLGALDRWKAFFTPEKKQIVEIAYISPTEHFRLVEQGDKALNDEIPEDYKFMGKHNQRVVEETRAMQHGAFQNTAGRGPQEETEVEEVIKEKTSSPTKKQADSSQGLPTLADLSPSMDIARQRDDNQQVKQKSRGPASATQDYLKDIKPSIQTMLNTREFVYYTYYQRIRSQLRQYWEPSIREKVKKIFAQGRTIASTSDHITKVIIVLNKEGTLIKVQVVENSGVYDLDEAAVEAFKAAEPFPNPPDGMIEDDGTIKIRWDFILEA